MCRHKALHTYMCADRHTRSDTYLLPPQNLLNSISPARFASRFGGQGGCRSIALNLPAPTALLWFNSVAKASPRQAPAHHVMMYCASWQPQAVLWAPHREVPAVPHPKHRWEAGFETGSGICWCWYAAVSPFPTSSIGVVWSDLQRSLQMGSTFVY